jgi:hypothetical protein
MTTHPSYHVYQHSEQENPRHALPPSRHSNVPEGSEWFYQPDPSKFIPPIPSERLVHYYNCPKACLDKSYCRDRFPKHIRDRPRIVDGDEEVASWGIELLERRDWEYLWVIGLIVFIVGGLFGLLWAILMHDIQGGYTVAGYIAGGTACLIGTIQVALDNA